MQKAFWVIVVLIIAFGATIFFIQRNAEPTSVTNLGDENGAVEAPSEGSPTAPSQAEEFRDPMMTGTWKSSTDAKFTREFRSDGIVTDRYENSAEASMSGTWNVVDPSLEAIANVPADSLQGMTVIRFNWDNDTKTYIAINALSETSMRTTDLSGTGTVTAFIKL